MCRNSHQYKKHSRSLNTDSHLAESAPLWNDHLVMKNTIAITGKGGGGSNRLAHANACPEFHAKCDTAFQGTMKPLSTTDSLRFAQILGTNETN